MDIRYFYIFFFYIFQHRHNVHNLKKFLILEGIYGLTGTVCNLPPLIKLRSKYKMRLFIDETMSLGALGKTGRGVTEHFSVNVSTHLAK